MLQRWGISVYVFVSSVTSRKLNEGCQGNRKGIALLCPLNRVFITDGKADFLGLILSLVPHSAGLNRMQTISARIPQPKAHLPVFHL